MAMLKPLLGLGIQSARSCGSLLKLGAAGLQTQSTLGSGGEYYSSSQDSSGKASLSAFRQFYQPNNQLPLPRLPSSFLSKDEQETEGQAAAAKMAAFPASSPVLGLAGSNLLPACTSQRATALQQRVARMNALQHQQVNVRPLFRGVGVMPGVNVLFVKTAGGAVALVPFRTGGRGDYAT